MSVSAENNNNCMCELCRPNWMLGADENFSQAEVKAREAEELAAYEAEIVWQKRAQPA